MRYERAYKEGPDRWEPVGREHVKTVFIQNFICADSVLRELDAGRTVGTPFALYRLRARPMTEEDETNGIMLSDELPVMV